MKYSYLLFAIILLITVVTSVFLIPSNLANKNVEPEFFVGVSFCGNTTTQAKLLVDRTKEYVNLFVLQSFPISRNESAIYEICDYAVAQGLNIIINLGTYDKETWDWHYEIFLNGKTRWGNQFKGVYYDDEPGGVQLDYNWSAYFANETNRAFFERILNNPNMTHMPPLVQMYAKIESARVNGTAPQDYELEAKTFNYFYREYSAFKNMSRAGIKTFTSDYALFWWDYLVGYDVILAQLGWNNSYIKDITFIRGAARLQNKEWGAIITWKYDEQPYLDSGVELYNQMLTAYQAGAKYVVVFNYPPTGDNPYGGAMTDEHFAALEKFSNDVMSTSAMRVTSDESQAEAVLVLPHNYAWGMRKPDDRIWGYWGPDEKSPQIWNITTRLLLQYRLRLDIVYDDAAFPVEGKYQHIYYWNSTLPQK